MITIKPLASGSKGNAFIVSDGDTQLLLDCGIPWKEILKKNDFIIPDAVLATHGHADHTKAITDILKRGIATYITQGTKDDINASEHHNLNIIKPLIHFNVGTWKIMPFDVQHDAKEPVGFICTTSATDETLVYMTDTMYSRYKFPNTTHWLVECNYIKKIIDENLTLSTIDTHLRNRIIKTHMSLETLKEMFNANDLSHTKEIYLMHLSDRNSDTERMKREIQQLTGKVVYVC